MNDVAPACEDTNAGDDWRLATEGDLTAARPCRYCFRDVDTVQEIDEPLEHLLVCDGPWAKCVHIHEEHGDPSYNTTSDQNQFADTLAETAPEDLGLSPLDGGEV